jgi:membrane-associated phospholipid phosphatase
MRIVVSILLLSSLLFSLSQRQKNIETLGDVLELSLPALGLVSSCFYEEGDEGLKEWAYGNGTTALITQVLKLGINKERPDGSDNRSFPSGHTSAAFAGATFLERRYGYKVGIPAYVAASFVGYSRIQADKHYLEDVLSGALIGIGIGYLFTTRYHSVAITPEIAYGYHGIKMSYNY